MAAFVLQEIADLRWPWLLQRQSEASFRHLSGIFLFCFLASQWYLSLLRLWGKRRQAKIHYRIHSRLGVAAPLLFYVHSSVMGYAYAALLSSVYFLNFAVGLFNPSTLAVRRRWVVYYWMVAHVALSVLVVVLAAYHLYVVIYYR